MIIIHPVKVSLGLGVQRLTIQLVSMSFDYPWYKEVIKLTFTVRKICQTTRGDVSTLPCSEKADMSVYVAKLVSQIYSNFIASQDDARNN